MNKATLINSISLKTGGTITKKDIELFIATFVEIIEETVCSGESIIIKDFGTFEKKATKGKSGVMNGKEWSTEDGHKAKFKPSKKLKDMVSKK
jgi:nucleoid DNA-binding protein